MPPAPSVPPVAFTTQVLPGAAVGGNYVASLQASGGSEPYTFSNPSGSLPPGLTLHSEGLLNGTPTEPGSYAFVLVVTSASTPAVSASQSFTIVVDPRLILDTAALPGGQAGVPYRAQLGIAGGSPPYAVTLTGGTLPAGLTLASSGLITGTPVSAGDIVLSLRVTDSGSTGQVATGQVALSIAPAPLALSYAAPAPVKTGAAVRLAASVLGGVPPYSFAIGSGDLPAGVTLQTDGSLSGTPTASGIFQLSVLATDSAKQPQSVSAAVTISVFDTAVQIDPTSAGYTVPSTAFGLHTSVYDNSLSDVGPLASLLPKTGIAMLRYPGGSFADVYHWAQYTTTPSAASGTACGVRSNGYLAPEADFGSFVRTLEATGTSAIITVNYGTSVGDAEGTRKPGRKGVDPGVPLSCSEPNAAGQPQEAAAWVAYANGDPADSHVIGVDAVGFDWRTTGFWAAMRAAAPLASDDGYNFLRLGHTAPIGIRFWEIGNEVYYNGYDDISVENDLHAPYVYLSGSESPVSRVGAAALSSAAYGVNAVAYLAAMKAVDPSIQIGFVLGAPTVDPVPPSWNPAALAAVCQTSTFDFAVEHYYPGGYNDVTTHELLASPQVNMPAVVSNIRREVADGCPQSGAKIPIFLTETNPNGTLAPTTPAGVVGLFATHVFLSALEAGVANVEWLQLHDLAGSYLSSPTEAPGPAFYGIELAHQIAGVGDTFVASTSSNPAVLVHATQKLDGATAVMLINTAGAASTVEVSVAGSEPGSSASVVSFGVATDQTGPDLQAITVPVQVGGVAIMVPPLTAVGVTIEH